jgi:hypothetical protein
MNMKTRSYLWSSVFICGQILLGMATAHGQDAAAQIRKLTGAHTRLVWVRSPNGTGDKFGPRPGASGPYVVVGFDTDAGGERIIVPQPGDWNHPLITPSGSRVIFSDISRNIYIVDWDGRNLKKLMQGDMAVAVAEDPPGTEWVYVAQGTAQPEGCKAIHRFQIEHPDKEEVVWDKTPSIDKWEITRDGKNGASRFPGTPGSVTLPNGELKTVAPYGCVPGISSDLSTVIHEITVSHGGIYLYNRDGSNRRQIIFGDGPKEIGLNHDECWWASFVRYESRWITFCGPYQRRGGAPGNVYFCQLNDKKDAFTNWIRVNTDNDVNTQAYALVLRGGGAGGGGTGITDGLTLKKLTGVPAQLEHATKFKPILDRMNTMAQTSKDADEAKEARQVAEHIGDFGKKQLAAAKELEATAPPEAQNLYKKLAAQFDGLETGAAAAQRLKEKDFLDGVKAWDFYDRILRAEKAMREVAGAKRSAADQKFAAANKIHLDMIKSLAHTLEQSFSATAAAEAARKIMTKYELAG